MRACRQYGRLLLGLFQGFLPSPQLGLLQVSLASPHHGVGYADYPGTIPRRASAPIAETTVPPAALSPPASLKTTTPKTRTPSSAEKTPVLPRRPAFPLEDFFFCLFYLAPVLVLPATDLCFFYEFDYFLPRPRPCVFNLWARLRILGRAFRGHPAVVPGDCPWVISF